jgi:Peptidase C13 family
MDSFSVETTFTLADWHAYQATFARKLQGDSSSRLPDENGMVLGPKTLRFASDGMTVQRANTTLFIAWSALKEVEIGPQHLFICFDRISAQMLPLRDLPAGMPAEEAAARIRTFATAAAARPSDSPPAIADARSAAGAAITASAAKSISVARPGALLRAIGFLTLRPRASALTPPTDWAICGFTVGGSILWLVLDRLRYGSNAEFVPYDAPGFAWYMLPCLLAAWVSSRLTRPRVEFRSILFLLVVLAPVLIGCAFLLAHDVPQKLVAAVTAALVVYTIVYLEMGLRALAGRRQARAATAIIAIALLFVAVNSSVYVYPTLWTEPDPDSAANSETRADKAEDLLISQGTRIDAEVGHITPAASDHPGIYFVGFAGVGRQKVFADEIKLAAQRISDHYDSAQRTVLLLNDRRDVESYPLATVAGLKLALKAVAAKMNVDQDVLFLALSSHGSADPSLSVSNGDMSLRDLSGADLADALRASGIKWRVIVISACYSGAFIDSLRDDNTIILTAAAADRTSFGCSDNRSLTYFGEAFYRDAFPGSASLQEAFSRATTDIASREQREGIRASKPQGFFGHAVEKQLAEVESAVHCNTGCNRSVPESAPIRSTQR